MHSLITLLVEHGLELLIGASTILALGCIALLFSRAPIHRQRLAELSIACFCLWLLVVSVPMPRLISWQAADREAALTLSAESVADAALPLPNLAMSPIPSQAGLTRMHTAVPAQLTSAIAFPPGSARNIVLRSPEQATLKVGPWLAWLFLGGSMLMLAGLGIGMVMLACQLARSRRAPAWLQCLGHRLQRETAASMRLEIRISARPTRPFCFGFAGGTIVLPAEICEPEKRIQLCQVLRHEIAHLQQRDTRGQLLFAIALPLLFFHPLYWWLRHQSRLSAELIADDQAARQSDRISYARELISLSQQSLSGPAGLFPAMPAIASKTQFYRRMTMLLQREDDLATRCTPLRRRLQLSLAGLLIATGASLWGVEPLAAQEPAPRAANKMQHELRLRQLQIEKLQVQISNLQRQLELGRSRGSVVRGLPGPLPVRNVKIDVLKHFVDNREIDFDFDMDIEVAVEEIEFDMDIEVEEIESEEIEVEVDVRRIDEQIEELREFAVFELLKRQPLVPMPVQRRNFPGVPVTAANSNAQLQDSTAILDLLIRQIDLDAKRRDVELRLSDLHKLASKGVVDTFELHAMQIELDSTSQKIKLLRRIMEVEAKACAIELEGLHRRLATEIEHGRSAYGIEANMLRLQTRLELLRSVH